MKKVNIEERLEKLGLTTVGKNIKVLKEMKRKMIIAYEHFRCVPKEKIKNFNKKLRDETLLERGNETRYKQLVFIPLEKYTEVPPMNVLNDLEAAQEIGCFDSYEIAKIEDIVEVKDPIVFGRIAGCTDRFFVSQWDDDVKIDDILKKNEG